MRRIEKGNFKSQKWKAWLQKQDTLIIQHQFLYLVPEQASYYRSCQRPTAYPKRSGAPIIAEFLVKFQGNLSLNSSLTLCFPLCSTKCGITRQTCSRTSAHSQLMESSFSKIRRMCHMNVVKVFEKKFVHQFSNQTWQDLTRISEVWLCKAPRFNGKILRSNPVQGNFLPLDICQKLLIPTLNNIVNFVLFEKKLECRFVERFVHTNC